MLNRDLVTARPIPVPRLRERRLAVLTLSALLLFVSTQAAEANDSKLSFKTERLIVFKDGYSLILKTAEGTTNDKGELYTDDVPESAVLGSFWAHSNQDALKAMVAGWHDLKETIEKSEDCVTEMDLLRANIGKKVELTTVKGKVIKGTIAKVLGRSQDQEMSPSLRREFGLEQPEDSDSGPGDSTKLKTFIGQMFVLKTIDGDLMLRANQIERLAIESMTTIIKRQITRETKKKRLTLRFAKAKSRQKITLMYFRPGMRWVPTYRLHLDKGGANKAMLEMQAELINEAEDLKNVPMDIVVGVPNFRFRKTVSPLVLESQLRGVLTQAAPQMLQAASQFSNASYTQRAGEFRRRLPPVRQPEPSTVDIPSELKSASVKDLFVYSLSPQTLKKKERAVVPIFKATVPYKDVFVWDFHLNHSQYDLAQSQSSAGSPLRLATSKVWRHIELENNTKFPWTTGAVMLMQGQQPLAQELLTYCSPANKVRVPVTVAVNVHSDFKTWELERKHKAVKWGGYYYSQIKRKALWELCNNTGQDIAVEVVFRLGGKAIAASNDGEIKVDSYNVNDWPNNYRLRSALNNSSTVRWSFTLKPGKTHKAETDFHFFSRQ